MKRSKVRPSIADLRRQASLSVPEAIIVSGYSRARVEEKCDAGDFRFFVEGKRKRIVTASIFEYVERKAEEQVA